MKDLSFLLQTSSQKRILSQLGLLSLLTWLPACTITNTPLPQPTASPSASVSPEPSPEASPSISPSLEPSPTPTPSPSSSPTQEQARPQAVTLDLTLNNIAADFSSLYGATLSVSREGEGIIYEQYFFPSSELSKHLRFQPGDLTTGQSFSLTLKGTPDGTCLNPVLLGLKPENSSVYLESTAYRQAQSPEIVLNRDDFARLPSDASCLLGQALEGQVFDTQGEALESVSILAEITGEDGQPRYRNQQLSQAYGNFGLDSLPVGSTVHLSFSKAGYQPYESYYANQGGAEPLKIYLKALDHY